MSDGADYLKSIKAELAKGRRQRKRGDKLLQAFGYVRRRQTFVDQVNEELGRLGLVADPPISTEMEKDAFTTFRLIDATSQGSNIQVPDDDADPALDPAEDVKADLAEPPKVDSINPADLSVTVRNLDCATKAPVMVNPSDSIASALTKMQLNDYSQLVVGTGERSIRGVVSDRSVANQMLHGKPKKVDDCVESVPEVTLDEPLLDVVAKFQRHDCVLVFDDAKRIFGIVTPSDIAREFHGMTAPFLVIGEIETHLRWLIDRSIELTSVTNATSSAAPGDPPSKAADLTMGELERILENPDHWAMVGMPYDRADFCKSLTEMRKLRNETMHFGDPLSDAELAKLRNFADALRIACAAAAKNPHRKRSSAFYPQPAMVGSSLPPILLSDVHRCGVGRLLRQDSSAGRQIRHFVPICTFGTEDPTSARSSSSGSS